MKLFYLINRDGIKVEEIPWNANRLEQIPLFQRKKFYMKNLELAKWEVDYVKVASFKDQVQLFKEVNE